MDQHSRVQELLRMWADMKARRTKQEQQWKEIVRWISPDRDCFTDVVKGSPGFAAVYDGTPLSALTYLANGLQGYMANKSSHSFKIGLENSLMLRQKPFEGRLRRYMQELDDLFYWMLDRSNFYDATNEIFRVGGSVATATLYVDVVPGEDELVNNVIDPFDVWIAENESRRVDTVFRQVTLHAKDLVRMFGDSVDIDTRNSAEQQPYQEVKILHAVLPRDARDAAKIDNLNKPFASYWLLPAKNLMLRESGYDRMPYIVWRWSTPHGGVYGWGPSHNAYNTVVLSNQITKTTTEAAHASVWPALSVPQEMMGKVNINPKGMNPYMDPSRRIYPVQTVGSYPIAIDREQHMRSAIREFFYVDIFLALNQGADFAKRTATEVLEMQSEKAIMLGAVTARIESELFDPLFDRYFEIAGSMGWLPTPPPELYDVLGGAELKIDYIGPMTQVQQRFYAKQSIDMPLQRLLLYSQFWPEVRMAVDGLKLGKHIVNDSTLPQDIIADDKAVQAALQNMQRMQQANAQAEVAQKNARALKDLGSTDQGQLMAMAEQMSGGGA